MVVYELVEEDGAPTGILVDTEKATASWNERFDFDGRNQISKATGSQWEHEKLFRSLKGRYYIEHFSQWQGVLPYARPVDKREAARWLLKNGYDLPEDLAGLEEEIIE